MQAIVSSIGAEYAIPMIIKRARVIFIYDRYDIINRISITITQSKT